METRKIGIIELSGCVGPCIDNDKTFKSFSISRVDRVEAIIRNDGFILPINLFYHNMTRQGQSRHIVTPTQDTDILSVLRNTHGLCPSYTESPSFLQLTINARKVNPVPPFPFLPIAHLISSWSRTFSSIVLVSPHTKTRKATTDPTN
jgi:hypothetical protein